MPDETTIATTPFSPGGDFADFMPAVPEVPAEPVAEPEVEPKAPQPRDEKGRYADSESPVVIEIDIEGGGKQVFKGKDYEEVARKLAKAQTNASRKIREMAKAKPAEAKTTPDEPKPLDANEEFLLGQQLIEKPSEAIDKLLASQLGMNLKELRVELQENRELRAIKQKYDQEQAFLTAHPEFHPSVDNAKIVYGILEQNNLPVTKENLEYAFSQANDSGLLSEPPATPASNTVEAPNVEAPARIEQATTEVKPRKASSGLSSKQTVRSEQVTSVTAPTAEELDRLTPEQARERIVRALYAAKSVPALQ